LLTLARQLDKAALAEIYDQYSSALYQYASRQLGNVDLAEECVAEVFSRFIVALHKGQGPQDHMRAYLYRIAHNWITDTYRRAGPDMLELTELLHETSTVPEEGPEEVLVKLLVEQNVRAAFFHLTPDQRQVIFLRFIEGWKHKEIAKAIDKSVGAVKSIQKRGLSILQKKLILEKDGSDG